MTDKGSHELARKVPHGDTTPQIKQPIHFPYEQWLGESRDELTYTIERQLGNRPTEK